MPADGGRRCARSAPKPELVPIGRAKQCFRASPVEQTGPLYKLLLRKKRRGERRAASAPRLSYTCGKGPRHPLRRRDASQSPGLTPESLEIESIVSLLSGSPTPEMRKPRPHSPIPTTHHPERKGATRLVPSTLPHEFGRRQTRVVSRHEPHSPGERPRHVDERAAPVQSC